MAPPPMLSPSAVRTAPPPMPLPTTSAVAPPRSQRGLVLLSLGGGLLLLTGSAIGLAVYFAGSNSDTDKGPTEKPRATDQRAGDSSSRDRARPSDSTSPPSDSTKKPPKPPPKPKTPPEFTLPEEQQRKVDAAILKGVTYLKKCINDCGTTPTAAVIGEPIMLTTVNCPGAMSLAGLTLLSCGVAPTDDAVQKAAKYVRTAYPNWSGGFETYEHALAILFLDRLGDAKDKELIQRIALRLIAGQNATGGWGYNCPVLDATVSQALMEALKKPDPLDAGTPDSVRNYSVLTVVPGKPITLKPGTGYSDNSLVQFAVLALWVAQKHDVPAQRSLLMAAERFRTSQNADGSWGYRPTGGPDWSFFDSMTCAGLISLAVARGAGDDNGKSKVFFEDPMIEKALKFVSGTVGKDRLPPNAPTPPGWCGNDHGRLIGANAWGDLYYLWTLERMAVIFNLKTVKGKLWYPWGAAIIVDSQETDGSWKDRFHGPVDTCFALLFLRRVNVATDLTEKLQIEAKGK
jgi:hypothetical protein